MLSQSLIKSALALTWKTMEDMYEKTSAHIWICWDDDDTILYGYNFSSEKFCYYLLDKKFLIKYYQNKKPWYTPSIETTDLMAGEFWYAIMEYQSDNENPLIELLEKICKE